ncbi:thioesterase II family protein [Streptomyces sp. NPDC102437]|uniref:thioesterase II family protein n=1 Tax=Streptomyces sp. NPDC102437 TaxID=3366175 RepID=UPI0037F57F26
MNWENSWVRDLRRVPAPAGHVLFFPHAGGAATYFRPLAAHFTENLDVSAVQYPGRQERLREPFVTTIESLADQVICELEPLLGTPLLLFGHSMGAAVAYEVARRLESQERPPCGLVVSGRRAPSMTREEVVHRGTDEEVLAELARLDGTSQRLLSEPDIVRMVMPVIRNDYRAIERYRPDPASTLGVPILCLTGDDDPQVTRAEAEAWKGHTTAYFRELSFSGGHFYLMHYQGDVVRSIESFAFEARSVR